MNRSGFDLGLAALLAALAASGCQSSSTPAPAELAHGDLTSASSSPEVKPQKPATQPSNSDSPATNNPAAAVPSNDPSAGTVPPSGPAADEAPAGDAPAGAPDAVNPGGANPGGGLRAMPNAGQSSTEVSGCLAKNLAEQAQTPATRSRPKPDAIRVTATGNGIIATHELGHACCLTSKTQTKIEQQHVTITETLEGKPCRCMCASTLQTRVGLQPGDYTVTLQLERAGKTETVHEQSVKIGMKRLERR